LDHRRRAGPRCGARRRGHRGPGRQGQARWPGGTPREISFTASLPAALTAASRDAILAGVAPRRVDTGRNRHRDRQTKAWPGFPPGGPHLPTRTAVAQVSVCGPLAT
jgi:hypothetical protein